MQKVFAKFFHPKPNKAHNSSLCWKVYDANDRAMEVEDRVDLEGGGAMEKLGGRAGGRNGGGRRGDRLLRWVTPRHTARLPEESRHAGWHDYFKSRATPHDTTRWRVTPKHVARLSLTRSAELPAWQVGHAKACGVILQWVAPRVWAWPKGLVLENLDTHRLLLKY